MLCLFPPESCRSQLPTLIRASSCRMSIIISLIYDHLLECVAHSTREGRRRAFVNTFQRTNVFFNERVLLPFEESLFAALAPFSSVLLKNEMGCKMAHFIIGGNLLQCKGAQRPKGVCVSRRGGIAEQQN